VPDPVSGVTTVAHKLLRGLLLAAVLLCRPSLGLAGSRALDPKIETPAARARRRAENRIVVVGCVLLVVGLVRWGRDLAAMWRKRRATLPPWQESDPTKAERAQTRLVYHPPPDKADAGESPEEEHEDADATVRIDRRRRP
jgi:hypothetical protein